MELPGVFEKVFDKKLKMFEKSMFEKSCQPSTKKASGEMGVIVKNLGEAGGRGRN